MVDCQLLIMIFFLITSPSYDKDVFEVCVPLFLSIWILIILVGLTLTAINEIEIFENGILMSTTFYERRIKKRELCFLRWEDIRTIRPIYRDRRPFIGEEKMFVNGIEVINNKGKTFSGHLEEILRISEIEEENRGNLILSTLKEKLKDRWEEVYEEDPNYLDYLKWMEKMKLEKKK